MKTAQWIFLGQLTSKCRHVHKCLRATYFLRDGEIVVAVDRGLGIAEQTSALVSRADLLLRARPDI